MQIRAFLISGQFRIHRAGCQDWKKDARRSDSSGHPEDFPTKAAVLRSLWADIIAEDPAFYATPGGMATLPPPAAWPPSKPAPSSSPAPAGCLMSDPRPERPQAAVPVPSAEPDPAWLTGLPPAVRGHPLFRQGYNLGYSHRAGEEPRASSRTGSDPAPPAPADPPAIFNVTAGGLRHRLAPRTQALRDLTALASGCLSTETPCCGRRITLPAPGEDQTRPAFCCRCRILHAVGLTREEPDGFGGEPPLIAVFTVQQVDIALAQHRTGKWERHPGRP